MISNAKDTYNTILQNIRSSNLNLVIQETPYSVFLTIRKTVRRDVINHSHYPEPSFNNFKTVEKVKSEIEASLEIMEEEKRNLQIRNIHLERANADLTKNCSEEVEDHETLKADLDDATEQLNSLKADNERLMSDLQTKP